MKALEILSPGPLTTVQDMGRLGFGKFGVPRSGAADPLSLRVANLLVGNREGDAGLEMTVIGARIKALRNVAIAVTGADLQPAINGLLMKMWRSHVLRKGDILSFKRRRSGCRAYLAIGGGIHVPHVMGSRSTNLTAGFGGLGGRPLRGGDVLCCDSPGRHLTSTGKSLDSPPPICCSTNQRLRVIPGPQDHHFSIRTRDLFFSSLFRVTPQSDRAGIRLAGPPIKALEGVDESILSEGVVPGAIQVPGDAQPIILLGETATGGYRKIATVISADLPLAAQLTPGNSVHFSAVSLDEALEAARQTEEMLRRLRSSETDLLLPTTIAPSHSQRPSMARGRYNLCP